MVRTNRSQSRRFTVRSGLVASVAVLALVSPTLAQQEDTPERTEIWEPEPSAVVPGTDGNPPSDAIVLFDGTNLDAWQSVAGGEAGWSVADGAMTVVGGTGDIVTRQGFGDVQLHVEWRTPDKIAGDGQERGNSGVFLMRRYELQVLDSYDNRTYSNGQAASLYKQHIPAVDASRAPGQWQAYDVIFRAPSFAADGTVARPAVVTVLHNGVLVHDHVELKGPTAYIGDPAYELHGPREPIQLQDHGSPVSFRNVWVRELESTSERTAQLDLERLYSLPRVIGTTPTGTAWSPDSRQVAFLWNDAGTNFRDVWTASVDDPTPVRLTAFPQPDPAAETVQESPGGVAGIRARESAALDGGAAGLAWFPDGEHLLVSFRGNFYRVDPGASDDPTALGLAGRQPQFAPDGSSLAYLSRGEVWIVPLDGADVGEPRAITTGAGAAVGVSRYVWAPDSSSMAVLVRDASAVAMVAIPDYLGEATTATEVRRPFPGDESGRQTLQVVDVEDGSALDVRYSDDDRDLIFTLTWSGDSARLLIDTSDLYVKDRRLLAANASTGDTTLLYREQEPNNVMASWSAGWAVDGGVLFTSDRDDFYHLYHLAAGGEPRALTRGDWAVESFHAVEDEIFVVANAAHRAERQIYRLGDDPSSPFRLSRQAGTHAPTYSPDGRLAAVLFSSDSAPLELYLTALDTGAASQVTDSPLEEFDAYDWVAPEYVNFDSHVDGATIHGRLMLPPDFDPSRQYPAIIGSIYSNTLRNQWGGRNAHPLWGLDQYLLDQGYVLLNINIRGSWGHGRDFRRKMQLDYGGIDTEDIYSGVQYLESLGYVDTERIGLWGSSYGGLMTAMSLFKRPGVFAAGVAGAPATNVWHALTGEMRVMGRPQDQPEAYAASSAFTHAAGLEDPLMIIHGMRDRVVLFKDSLVLLENLMLHGKAGLLELVPLPNSPHGWDTRELYQTRFAFEKLVAHFDRHLKPSN